MTWQIYAVIACALSALGFGSVWLTFRSIERELGLIRVLLSTAHMRFTEIERTMARVNNMLYDQYEEEPEEEQS